MMDTNRLFDLYDELTKVEKKIDNVIGLLGGDPNFSLLEKAMDETEILIVLSMGGTLENAKQARKTDDFYMYREGEISREELKDYLREVIENDLEVDDSIIIRL